MKDYSQIDSTELLKEYFETKNVDIRNELIGRYIYIAEIAAKKFTGRGVDYDDLVQVASLALVKAIERFDPYREIKFPSFATPSLIGEIKNYFRDTARVMRLPRKNTMQLRKINDFISEYMLEHDEKPSVKLISEKLDIPVDKLLETFEVQNSEVILSLDSAMQDGENFSLDNFLGKEDERFEWIENHDFIKYCMDLLTEEEKRIIRQRYIMGKTQKEVANNLNVSQMQISRLERKILDKLSRMYSKQ